MPDLLEAARAAMAVTYDWMALGCERFQRDSGSFVRNRSVPRIRDCNQVTDVTVGEEEKEVSAGTLVLVPPAAGHAILNTGDEPLVFISATSPPFEMPPEGSPFVYGPPP